MFKSFALCVPVVAAALLLAGCATTKESESQCRAVKPGVIKSVNSLCVMVNDDPVDPECKTATFKGQQVGFCCAACIPKWEALSDDQKAAALAKALAAAKK